MATAKTSTTSAWRRAAALGLAASLLALALPSFASAADCPNEAIRESQTSEVLPQGTTTFPACMALELLSPPKKWGAEATELTAFSPDATRALYKSKAALADTEGLQTFVGDSYIGLRGASGWVSAATSPSASYAFAVGTGAYAGPYAFTPGLGAWASLAATKAQQFAAEGQFFSGGLDGSLAPLSPLLIPINDSGTSIKTELANMAPSGIAADLSATVFSTAFGTTYFPADPPRDSNRYLAYRDEAGEPSLALLNRDKDGVVHGGRCGAVLGGSGDNLNQGAISADGSRIYLSTRPAQPWDEEEAEGPACEIANPLRIMVRSETPAGPAISELLSVEPSAPGDDLYQGASLDGSKVFLATPRKLTASDKDTTTAEACSSTLGASKGCDLYLYDADLPEGARLTQVSAGENVTGKHQAGKEANVLTSVVALSPDGSHAYFVAQAVLTDDQNPTGDSATAGQPNLYLYEASSGETSFVGALAEDDAGGLWGLARSFSNGAYAVPLTGGLEGGDGHILLLTSKAPLTVDDGDAGLADVFRYDSAAETLECISCSAAAPQTDAFAGMNGALLAPPSSTFATQGRWASEDAETVVFATAQPLVEGDEDGEVNPYLWKEGQLTRLPGNLDVGSIGQLEAGLQLPILSLDGDMAGFSSTEALLPIDGDSARDVYVARADGGFPNPAPPAICDPLSEGSCQGAAGSSGAAPGIATATFAGPGNPKARPGCTRQVGRALRLSRRAKALRRQAARATRRGNPRAARRIRRRAQASAKRAKGLSRKVKRCRRSARGAGK